MERVLHDEKLVNDDVITRHLEADGHCANAVCKGEDGIARYQFRDVEVAQRS